MEEIRSSAKEYIDDQIGQVKELLQARFEGLNAKLDGAVEGLNAKLDGAVEGLNAKLDGAVEGLNAKLDGLGAKVDALLALYTPLLKEVRETREKVDRLTDAINSRRGPIGFREPPAGYGEK